MSSTARARLFRWRPRYPLTTFAGAEMLVFAARRLRWIRYLQTVQGEVSGKIGFSGAEIAMKTAVSNAVNAEVNAATGMLRARRAALRIAVRDRRTNKTIGKVTDA
ncbi:hypothetical protein ACFQ1S_03835 [Kibdelosporangium lantanae]|uniref:Uncharacterized protein n=1 Tax=Kibdelosporangium lantanae TaxID=1497396 RepID=A0ABW3M3X5_9PSEU